MVKIKVLQVTQSAGGIETYLLLLMKHIDHNRFDVSLVCPQGNGTLFEKASALGVRVYPVQMVREITPLQDFRNLFEITGIIGKLNPAIVHVHSSKAGILGRLASFRAHVPCLYTPNAFAYLGQAGLKRRLYLTFEQIMRPLTTVLVAASPSEARRAVDDVHFSPDVVNVFTNSIEMDSNPVTTSCGGADEPIVMMVGRLIYQKNPEMFIRVASIVAKKVPRARFLMVGSGFQEYERNRIDAMIRNLSLTAILDIIPWMDRSSLMKILGKAAVIVVPSRFESFGYIAAEAGLLHKPVVATNVDGLVDVVADGETGYLVDIDDDHTMADRVIDLLESPDLRARMGEAGRRRVEAQFNIIKNIRQIERIYTEIYHQALEHPA